METKNLILKEPSAEELSVITVSQLPIIEEQLSQLKPVIEERTSFALGLECTEGNKQDVKGLRANLTKEKKSLTEKYNQAMEQAIAPIKAVQAKFKDCINCYTEADDSLKTKIAVIEDAQKDAKRETLKAYFDECVQAKGIDFLEFDRLGLKITLSATEASLKKQVANIVGRVATDLKMIATQEDEEEILIEYKQTLNASEAITIVKERKQRIQAEKNRKAQEAERISREQKAEQAVMQAAEEQTKQESAQHIDVPFPEVEQGQADISASAEMLNAPTAETPNLKRFTYNFAVSVDAISQEEANNIMRDKKPKMITWLESEGLYYGK